MARAALILTVASIVQGETKMSTRCVVQVMGPDGGPEFSLYHHYDGYPSNMLDVIAKAYRCGRRKIHFVGGRGHASALLCGADPSGFEAEASNVLHGDIEYLYRLRVEDNAWRISVFRPASSWDTYEDFSWVGELLLSGKRPTVPAKAKGW
jgi:hypothetical protein